MTWAQEALDRGAVHVLADDITDPTWFDEHADSRDATITGGTVSTSSPPGNFANYVSHDGVDDRSESPVPAFGNKLRTHTLEAIVKLVDTTSENQALTGVFNEFGGLGYHVLANSNEGSGGGDKLDILVRRAGGTSGSLVRFESTDAQTSLNDGEWHHLVCTVVEALNSSVTGSSGPEAKVWVDKVSQTVSVETDGVDGDQWDDFSYDLPSSARNLKGSLDKFAQADIAGQALYPDQLTQTDVDALYDAAFGTGQTVTVGQATETDSAQSIGAAKNQTAGQAVETSTAQGVTPERTHTIGQASETSTAQPIGSAKTQAVGQAVESDSAQGVTPERAHSVGQASETDTAQGVSATLAGGQTVAVGQATETDTAQAVGASKSQAVGQASETDSAQGVSAGLAVTVGQASETDSAQAVSSAKTQAIGQASETDSAQGVTPERTHSIGQASESNTARSIGALKTLTVGQAVETSTAQAITALKNLAIGQAVETDTAQSIGVTLGEAQGMAITAEGAHIPELTAAGKHVSALTAEGKHVSALTASGSG